MEWEKHQRLIQNTTTNWFQYSVENIDFILNFMFLHAVCSFFILSFKNVLFFHSLSIHFHFVVVSENLNPGELQESNERKKNYCLFRAFVTKYPLIVRKSRVYYNKTYTHRMQHSLNYINISSQFFFIFAGIVVAVGGACQTYSHEWKWKIRFNRFPCQNPLVIGSNDCIGFLCDGAL